MWADIAWKIYVFFSVVMVTITLLTALTLVIAEIVYYTRENSKVDKLPHNDKNERRKDDF